MNIEKFIIHTNEILNQKLKELELLEEEKKEIINRYKIANKIQRNIIEAEIRKNEKRFKDLYNEVSILSIKIKKLKKQYC